MRKLTRGCDFPLILFVSPGRFQGHWQGERVCRGLQVWLQLCGRGGWTVFDSNCRSLPHFSYCASLMLGFHVTVQAAAWWLSLLMVRSGEVQCFQRADSPVWPGSEYYLSLNVSYRPAARCVSKQAWLSLLTLCEFRIHALSTPPALG